MTLAMIGEGKDDDGFTSTVELVTRMITEIFLREEWLQFTLLYQEGTSWRTMILCYKVEFHKKRLINLERRLRHRIDDACRRWNWQTEMSWYVQFPMGKEGWLKIDFVCVNCFIIRATFPTLRQHSYTMLCLDCQNVKNGANI